ncbi:hypothetical protein KR038_004406, partial [Drosophila bunnanda]
SAAVRTSLLSKEDIKSTVLVPEELRDPTAALAACPSNPKRSELEQRQLRRTQCASELQELICHKKAKSAVTVKCMPFVKTPQSSGENPMKTSETAEQLMAQERDPMKLAVAFISLRTELQAERAKSEAITQNYLELRQELFAKNNELKAVIEKK